MIEASKLCTLCDATDHWTSADCHQPSNVHTKPICQALQKQQRNAMQEICKKHRREFYSNKWQQMIKIRHIKPRPTNTTTKLRKLSKVLTSHQIHYRSYRGWVFMDRMTKHLRCQSLSISLSFMSTLPPPQQTFGWPRLNICCRPSPMTRSPPRIGTRVASAFNDSTTSSSSVSRTLSRSCNITDTDRH